MLTPGGLLAPGLQSEVSPAPLSLPDLGFPSGPGPEPALSLLSPLRLLAPGSRIASLRRGWGLLLLSFMSLGPSHS